MTGTAALIGGFSTALAWFLTPWVTRLARREPAWLRFRPHVSLAAASGIGASLLSTTWVEALAYGFLGIACAVLVVVDLADLRLPDVVVLPMYPVLLFLLAIAAASGGEWARFGRAALAGGILLATYFAIAFVYPPGMGLGDVKLAGPLGLFLGWLGWSEVLLGTVAGFIVNALVSLVLLVLHRVDRNSEVPFGPAMIVGAIVGAAWGPLVFTGVA